MLLTLPHVLVVDEVILKNRIRQICERSFPLDGTIATFTRGRVQGFLFQPRDGEDSVLILPRAPAQIPDGYPRVLHATLDPRGQQAV